jgi:hypothetical protein
MVAAEAFVRELEEKNQNQLRNLLAAYGETIQKENLSPADLLRLEQKAVIEAIEVSALWLADSDDLETKVNLATRIGDGARHFRLMQERLNELGLPPTGHDPRFGGYSKLFAFFRSLQTAEERTSASALTLKEVSARRLGLIADRCDAQGDTETARLFRDVILADEDRHIHAGRQTLIAAATAEESQARARRAAFRTLELLQDVFEPSVLRKFLARSLKK